MDDRKSGPRTRPLHMALALGVTVLVLGCDRAEEDRAAQSASQAVRSANQALNKAEAVAREGAREAGQFARTVGEAAEEGARLLNDGGLTAKVKTALLTDDTVAGTKIDVDSDGGVVTLTGRLSSQAEVERAVTIARAVDGVERVENRLTAESAG